DMDHDKEFRIFVYNNRITAISCQHLYNVNEWLCNLSVKEKEQVIQLILEYFNSNIRDKLTFIGSYTMDLVLLDSNEEHMPYFIEPNSFGSEYASCSALFHWELDKEILYGEDMSEFRYTTN
ncbi:MAG: hypothetical protein KC414_14230, partial [Romboutsia sp.]|nr:hypothetical protein [Romboutsia sp.]